MKSGSLGIGENAELNTDAVSITEFIANPWEEFLKSVCKKESEGLKPNKKVIDTDQGKIEDSDSQYDDDDDNEVLGNEENEDDDDDGEESTYDEEDERIIEQLENNREIKLGNKGGHKGIKEKEFLAEEVRKSDELADDIDDCKFPFGIIFSVLDIKPNQFFLQRTKPISIFYSINDDHICTMVSTDI